MKFEGSTIGISCLTLETSNLKLFPTWLRFADLTAHDETSEVVSLVHDSSSCCSDVMQAQHLLLASRGPSTLGRCCTNRAEILRQTKALNSRKLLLEKE